MKRLLFCLSVLAAPALSDCASAAPQVTPLAATGKTVTGQDITAPEHPNVIATIVTFPPGDRTATHKHLWPHYGYMLEGVLTVTNAETGQSFELKPGDFLVEMLNTAHYGENRGTVPARMLIVDTVPPGETGNSVPVP